MSNKTINIFRLIAFFEGLSLIILIGIAMPLKYIAGKPEAVQIVGMAHGVLFVLYVIDLLFVHLKLKWTLGRTSMAFVASFVPFGTFYADKKIFRED